MPAGSPATRSRRRSPAIRDAPFLPPPRFAIARTLLEHWLGGLMNGEARPKGRRKFHSLSLGIRRTGDSMDDRFNTIAGWVLFAGIVALGGSIVAGEMFHGERPEKMGYPIEGVVQSKAKAARKPRSRSHSIWPAPIRPRASRSSRSAPPATTPTRAAPTHSARTCGACSASRSARARRLRFLARACGRRRHLELGQSERLAGQPEEVRARHQDDLRRPQQPAGPRQRHRLPECAQRRAAAAARPRRPRLPPPTDDKAAATKPGTGPEQPGRRRPRTSLPARRSPAAATP